MTDLPLLTARFEAERPNLRAVAYRMLGSVGDANDAVQEGWIRLQRSDSSAIDNVGAWLTTVVGRICVDILRARRTRGETPLEHHVPDPVLADPASPDSRPSPPRASDSR